MRPSAASTQPVCRMLRAPVAIAALLLLSLASLAAAAFQPIADVPYVEVISSRMTCNDGGASVGPWTVTPLSSPADAVAPLYDPPGFLVLSSSGVWAVSLPAARSAETPGMTTANASLWQYPSVWQRLTGLGFVAGSDAVVTSAAVPGSVVGVAKGGAGLGVVQVVSCSLAASACKVVSNATAPWSFGKAYQVAVSWPTPATPVFWIACDAGLVSANGTQFALHLNSSQSTVAASVTTVAVSSSLSIVAAGNMYHLWYGVRVAAVCQIWCSETCHHSAACCRLFNSAAPGPVATWEEWATDVPGSW